MAYSVLCCFGIIHLPDDPAVASGGDAEEDADKQEAAVHGGGVEPALNPIDDAAIARPLPLQASML